jgi:glycerophosphoryl diester phosphodiesterase
VDGGLNVTLAVAHRGDPYTHRENTLASVRSALRLGADAVEVDVRLTADGVPVLLHDATLERLWGAEAAVADLSYEALARATGRGVPSLADALAEVGKSGTCRALLDLAGPGPAAAAVAAVCEAGLGERAYYCGGPAAMRAVRERDATAEIALTWKTSARPAAALLAEIGPRWLNLRFGLVDAPTVAFARERGLLVSAWTADRPRSMARLLAYGVDAITTNRLAALRRVMARHAARTAAR